MRNRGAEAGMVACGFLARASAMESRRLRPPESPRMKILPALVCWCAVRFTAARAASTLCTLSDRNESTASYGKVLNFGNEATAD
eukprot:5634969-Pleurochrysis_carterae.AAC.2